MTPRLSRYLAATAGTLMLAASVHASPLMEMDADNLVRGAAYVKNTLGLTPNQQTLWQQVSSKSAGLLRARQSRRDKLQAALKAQLQLPSRELRDLSLAIDQEALTSAQENKELRELWLSVNDALNDAQRTQVSAYLVSQLDRVEAPERAAAGPGPGAGRGEHPEGGQRRQKPGADMGGSRF